MLIGNQMFYSQEWKKLFSDGGPAEKFVVGECIDVPADFKNVFFTVREPSGKIVDFGFPMTKHPMWNLEILEIFQMQGYPSSCFFALVEDDRDNILALHITEDLVEANR